MKRLAFLVLAAAMPALARHGWSEYDASQSMDLMVTVEESGYMHPHGPAGVKTANQF